MSLPLLHHLSTESEGHLSVSHRVQSLVLPPQQSSGHPHEGALNVGVVLGRRLNGVQHVFGSRGFPAGGGGVRRECCLSCQPLSRCPQAATVTGRPRRRQGLVLSGRPNLPQARFSTGESGAEEKPLPRGPLHWLLHERC